jgi:uncharacterized membrane protein YfcA
MSLTGLVPTDVTANAALAISVIAFVSGAARGFSGFGSALIFMPLASSLAPPPLVAAVLLIIDIVAAAPLIPNAWRHADRKAVAIMALGMVGTPLGTYALTQLDPLTTRWIISVFVLALLMLLVSGWRYRGKDHLPIAVGIGGVSGFCSGLAQTGGPPIVAYWLGRPIFPLIARANILSFFAASDIFSAASYSLAGLITSGALKFSLVVGPAYAIGVLLGARLFGKASETLFRSICYALIALAALIGLPLLDSVLR